MAGIDHDVHEKTREVTGTKWGCHNRPPFKDGYWSPDRVYREDGTYFETKVFIKNVMSKTCRNDVSLSDRKCPECKHIGQGEIYSEFVRRNGT